MKKTALTAEIHRDLGAKLYETNAYLVALSVQVDNAYAKASPGGKAARALEKAHRALCTARSELESQMYQDLGIEGAGANGGTTVYYPGVSRSQR